MSENLPVPSQGDREGLEVVEVKEGMFGVTGTGDTSGFGGLERDITIGQPTQPPFGSWYDEAAAILAECLPHENSSWNDAIEYVVVDRDEFTLHVRREAIVQVCQILRDDPDLRFELTMGVSGVHYPQEKGRELHAVYHLRSMTHNHRLRLEVAVSEDDPHIPTTTDVYPAHNWHERETWDMFGIIFDGHPALARILMPDDWPGHPQRKDYPLGGIPVEYKGATTPPADERRSYN